MGPSPGVARMPLTTQPRGTGSLARRQEQASQRLHGLRLLAASLSLAHPLDHLTSSSRQPPNYPSPLLVCLHSAPEAPLGPAAWGLCPWEDRGPGGVGR